MLNLKALLKLVIKKFKLVMNNNNKIIIYSKVKCNKKIKNKVKIPLLIIISKVVVQIIIL